MANNYKKVMTTVTSTGDATIYTVPAETTTLVKTAWAYNNSGGSAAISLKINSTLLSTNSAVADKATESFFIWLPVTLELWRLETYLRLIMMLNR